MNHEVLGNRRRALEESFFARQNNKLLEQLRSQSAAEELKKQLSEISGIEDSETLQQMADADIQPETFAAVSLIPVVAVAWADGTIDDKERAAILSVAADQGLAESGPAHQLLQDWLTTQPAADLLATWQDYIRAFCETVSAEAKANLESQVMGRAKSIASATGGILGLGNKISASEQNTLDELAAAFAQTE
ncbi:MAG: hypothetical protein VB857_10565 [Pirellulaceae bacterium]